MVNNLLKNTKKEINCEDKETNPKNNIHKFEKIIFELENLKNKIIGWNSEIRRIQLLIIDQIINNVGKNNNEAINLNNENYNNTRNSLLTSDPDDQKNKGKAVISLCSTIKKLKKDVDNLSINQNNKPKFKEILELLGYNITNNFSNKQKVEALINKRLSFKLFEKVMFMDVTKSGELTLIDYNKRSALIQKIMSHLMELPDKLVNNLLKNERTSKDIALEKCIIDKSVRCFNGDSNNCINVNNEEINEKNIEKYAKSINEFIKQNYKSFRQIEIDRRNISNPKGLKCNIL